MNSLFALLPVSIMVFTALLILILEAFLRKERKEYLAYVSIILIIVGLANILFFWNKGYSYFENNLILDNFALFLSSILCSLTILTILISIKYLPLQNVNYGEYYSLLLLALTGMMIMVSSEDLLVIFLGLEVLSISSYALAGLKRNDLKSSEAAMKYFLLGSFASAFLVYGVALLYGACHSTNIQQITAQFKIHDGLGMMAIVGLGLLIISFGFKIALVPFHMWTPDVYEGAPTPVTALFSVGPKAVGFAVFLRVFSSFWRIALDSQAVFWLLWIMSALTMIIGNLIALRQRNVKRILAYSSIAHAGYILIAILAQDTPSLIFYLTVYLFMNLGAFASVIALSKKDKEYLELEEYSGVGFKFPWIGATFSLFLFSLAGFPPTGGFLAKFFVFSAAVRQGLVPLVIIGVLTSLVSVFYYLRIIIFMYMREPSYEVEIHAENPALLLVIFLCALGVLELGIFPGNILVFIKQAADSLHFF